MVKKLTVVLLLSIPVVIFGQTIDDFNSVVDFASTLSELDQAAMGGGTLPSRFVIIEGAVAARQVINGEADQYLGELELITGEWVGVEKVVRYECILQLVGPEFASAIPARRSRTANPAEISLNTRVLAVAKAVSIRQLDDGTTIPVLRAYFIRKIQ